MTVPGCLVALFSSAAQSNLKVSGFTTDTQSTSSTTHTYDISGLTVNAGDTIMVVMSGDGGGISFTGTGYTVLASQTTTESFHVLYKKATGSETNVVLTSGSATTSVAAIYVIEGAADPTVTPPEASTVATGGSGQINPPTFSPTGGSGEYLWIGCGQHPNVNVPTGGPSGYTFDGAPIQGSAVSVATAHKVATASSEDPGAFSGATSAGWKAFTLAVYAA